MTASLPLDRAIADLPLPIALFDAESLRLVRSSSSFRRLLRPHLKSYDDLFAPERQEAAIDEFRAVSSGRFDGIHGRRTLVEADETHVEGHLWLRRISENDGDLIAVVFVPDHEDAEHKTVQAVFVDGHSNVALLVTDHDWMLRFVSRDIETILGEKPDATVGKPLLSLVHPAVAAEFLLAVTRAIATRRGAVAHLQLPLRSEWQSFTCWIEPLCDHTPPRLGLVLMRVEQPHVPPAGSSTRLEQHLWRIAAEIQAAGVLPTSDPERQLPLADKLTKLTSHQWEITMRLVNGERVPAIAKALHLSQSTVRNHLSAAFRRFGVHSQSELISLLKRPPVSEGER